MSTYPGTGVVKSLSHDTSVSGPVGVKFSAIGENSATSHVVIYMAFNDCYTGGSAWSWLQAMAFRTISLASLSQSAK